MAEFTCTASSIDMHVVEAKYRFAVVISFLVGYVLSLVVSLLDLAGGETGLAGWSGMIITVGFTLAFVAAAVKERRDGAEAKEW